MPKDPAIFAKKIGLTFTDPELLCQAFTHRSYLNENRPPGGAESTSLHNERLEFLGDAVLELVITNYLYKKYPTKTEGNLTAYRAALVNATTIGQIAEELGVNEYLRLSRGEAQDTGRARQIILANTYEAIIGAIYLDQGYDSAERFLATTLFPSVTKVVAEKLWQDAKSYFQERAQEVTALTPHYEVLEESGPDHDKTFLVGVYLGDILVAKGSGHSKQEAEQAGARAGLKAKGWDQ